MKLAALIAAMTLPIAAHAQAFSVPQTFVSQQPSQTFASPAGHAISGPGPGDIYSYCMQNVQTKSVQITDQDLRKSFLDHAAEACVAAEAKRH